MSSGITSSTQRISGLVSGWDTDTMVKNLMKAESAKQDKIKQNRQVLAWQQEDYRSMNSLLRNLRDKVSNMKLQSSYLVNKTTSSNESVVKVTANTSAVEGIYTLNKVTQLASGASITSGEVNATTDTTTSTVTNATTMAQLGLANYATSTTTMAQLGLTGSSTTVKIGNDTSSFDLTINSTDTIDDLVSHINDLSDANSLGINASFDAISHSFALTGTNGITLTDDSNSFLKNNLDFDNLAVSGTNAITSGTVNSTLITIANGTKSAQLTIKASDTIYQLVNNINNLKTSSGDSLGIKVSFDDNLHRFFMMTTSTGESQEITLTDDSNSFLNNTLKFTTLSSQGKDAIVDLNVDHYDIDGNAVGGLSNLHFSSNQFSVSGVTYNLVSTTNTATTITVSKDTDAIVSKIKDFVSSYNDTISELNDKLSEDRYSDYSPLTDEQKEAMSDTQQEQWEAKAKSGLLRNDSLLGGIVDNMRSSLYSQVEGMGTSKYTTLSSIGITTGTYLEKGKLYIDEDKLKAAINDDPDAVMNLFTKSSDTTEEKGLAVRLYDNINNGMTSISSKAGSTSSLVDNSYIGKRIKDFDDEIDDWDTRLADIQERYYKQFDAMEQALSKLNSQSSWLIQQFSS